MSRSFFESETYDYSFDEPLDDILSVLLTQCGLPQEVSDAVGKAVLDRVRFP